MSHHHTHPHDSHEVDLPKLNDLGRDLLLTTPRQRNIALVRPFIGLVLYAFAAWQGWWLITPIIVFFIFVSVVTVTHDVVHGTIGLGRRQTEWALFFMGIVLMESGHAYRITHHQHHTMFPEEEDPEGYPAKISLLGAIVYGPIFLVRLWLWAFKHRPDQRHWLIVEGLIPIITLPLGIALWETTPAVLWYWCMGIVGSWVYPLLTVYLPHKDYGDTPLTQTHTLRGRIIPAIFLELTYHLEHHLYPQVPSHNLSRLSHRLDPFLEEAGVEPWHVL